MNRSTANLTAAVAVMHKLDAIYAQRDELRAVVRAALAVLPDDAPAALVLRSVDLTKPA